MGFIKFMPNGVTNTIFMSTEHKVDTYSTIIEHLKQYDNIKIEKTLTFDTNFPDKNGKLGKAFPGLKFAPNKSQILQVSQPDSTVQNINSLAIKQLTDKDYLRIPGDLDVHRDNSYNWLVLMI